MLLMVLVRRSDGGMRAVACGQWNANVEKNTQLTGKAARTSLSAVACRSSVSLSRQCTGMQARRASRFLRVADSQPISADNDIVDGNDNDNENSNDNAM